MTTTASLKAGCTITGPAMSEPVEVHVVSLMGSSVRITEGSRYPTGGGIRTAGVSRQLPRALKERGTRASDVHDPAAEDELVRGATTIGGVSLLFG